MAGRRPIQGIERSDEVSKQFAQRDVRPLSKRFKAWISEPTNMVITMTMMTGAAWYYPAVADIFALLMLPLVLWALGRREYAPLKMPIQAGMPDPNELNPGTGKPMPAQGIFFLGNELESGKEVWLTNDDCRQHFLVVGTTGAGKSQNVDSLVHTPRGWRRIGDIHVNDLVSCPVTGGANPVTGVFPQGEREMWEVEFVDGRRVEVDAEHLWEVHHKHWNGKYKAGVSRAGMAKPRVITTRELRERMLSFPKGVFAVPLTAPVEKPEAELPIPAYALGALIGDGGFSGPSVTFCAVDQHNIERVSSDLASLGLEMTTSSNRESRSFQKDWRVRKKDEEAADFRGILSSLGLLGHRAWEKFIPAVYKEGSVEQRWALVQGLMDTDGTCDARKPVVTFCTTSERLARDLQEVVWSLGGIARLSAPRRKTYVHKGEKRQGRPSWLLYIRHPEPWRFFSLPRKVELAAKPYQHADRLKLAVARITPAVRRAEAVCIMVDHPRHLYVMDDYVVTHNTELLIGFAANAVSWGSGLLYCDGKGDVSLFAKMYALCRRWGREDDLLVINFMNGGKDEAQGKGVRSNTLNPFSTGASDGLTQMIVGLMPEAGGDGAMWKGRAVSMLTGVMKALVWLRDKGERELSVSSIRDAMVLKNIIELADRNRWPNMPEQVRKSVQAYLNALPGYQESKGAQQAQTTLDQHGYLQMQFSQIFGSLSDVYGHIFMSPYGQVDMNDVVLNRRILVIMLPALEKSGDEIANLGKIVAANLKGMMGQTLGNTLEGDWDTVVENRPTSAPSPYLVILDEVGYYTVDGMALMAAQARSLGFSMVYASQDIPAMERNNAKEAASIIANTNTKIFMRTEEAEKTGALAEKSAGETMAAAIAEVERFDNEVAGAMYRGGRSARLERRKRVDFLDLKSQGAGEMTVIHKGEVVRAKAFYASPSDSLNKRALELRANHFIEVHRPNPSDLEIQGETEACALALTGDVEALAARMEAEAALALDPDRLREAMAGGDEVAAAALTWRKAMGLGEDGTPAKSKLPFTPNPLMAGCAVVARLARDMVEVTGRAQAAAKNLRGNRSRGSDEGSSGFETLPVLDEGFGGKAGRAAGFPEPSDTMDAYLPDEPPVRVGPRPPVRTDPSVRHGVSADGEEIWKPGQRISDHQELMRALAELDENNSMEEMDGLLDGHLGVSGPKPDADEARNAAFAAEEYDRRVRILEETPTQAGVPPRRGPPREDGTDGSNGGEERGSAGSGSGTGATAAKGPAADKARPAAAGAQVNDLIEALIMGKDISSGD